MKHVWLFLPVLILLVPSLALSNPITIDFESFFDGDVVGALIPGLVFSNTTVLTAGISLNEFEFPPLSGANVAFDNGGPITIQFLSPISDFTGYFTYGAGLMLQGFDASNNLVASATSLFGSNLALSGDIGSSPNELIGLTFAGGISSLRISGSPSGGSFVMDDIQLTQAVTAVPEPSTLTLVGIGLASILCVRYRFRNSTPDRT